MPIIVAEVGGVSHRGLPYLDVVLYTTYTGQPGHSGAGTTKQSKIQHAEGGRVGNQNDFERSARP